MSGPNRGAREGDVQSMDLTTEGGASPSPVPFQAIVRSVPTHVLTARADGVDFANQRFLDYTGLSFAQALGSGWTGVVHADDRQQVAASADAILASGSPRSTEMRLRRHDGSYRWFLFEGSPLHDARGVVTGWCAVAMDVEDRKRAEDTVRRSEQELRALVDVIPGLIAVVNSASGDIEFVNQGVVDYFRRTLEELRQWRLSDSVHADDLPRVVGAWQHSLATGDAPEWEHRLRRSDGAYRWFQLRGFPWRNDSDGVVRWYCLITDIHDRKTAEEALRRSADALREMQDKLARAGHVATVGEMAASIAHEVNQPLAAVVANGHACVRWLSAATPNLGKALEAAERIVKDGKDAGDVVRRVRSLFKRAAVDLVPLDIGDVIEDVRLIVEAEASKRGVAVSVDTQPGLPLVRGDRLQLQQVVLNLILNAFDAMDPVVDRRRQLTVRARQSHDAGVVVEVVDNGIGLDDPIAMFEPFVTTKADGMGLGLAICHSIIAAHDGTLAATRNDDAGATVWFALPAEPGSQP